MGMVKTAVRMSLLRGEDLGGMLRSLHGVLPGLKEPSAYVTVAGLRFREPRVVEYATAGHLPILHYRRTTGTIERLSIEQFPIAMIASADSTAATAECERDDVFVMLTDGIVEATNTKDEEFGSERIERLLLDNATRPLAEIADAMLSASAAHGPQVDDQTILLARVMNETCERTSQGQGAMSGQ
jgi:sigma-B regulation protein RsbU (phosphoserine phosphatase)